MVRKGHRPWEEIKRPDPDPETRKRPRREMEEAIRREEEMMIRGDVEPETKK